jgi:hypothetical protein
MSEEAQTTDVAEEIKEEVSYSEDRRDALQRALAESTEKELVKEIQKAEPVKKEPEEKAEPTKLRAPPEFTKEEAQDFESLTPAQQKVQLRLHESRQRWAIDLNKRHENVKHIETIEADVGAYLKAMGDKNVDPRDAIFKAIKLYKEANTNPDQFAEEFIKAKKLQGWTKAQAEAAAEKIVTDPSLQARIDALEGKVKEEDTQRQTAAQEQFKTVFFNGWQAFENQKLENGEPKFPDVDNTEKGLQLASKIGSLVGGKSELSKQWLANLRERFPSATIQTAFEEAYKFYGGKVSQSDIPKVLTKDKNLERTKRLLASQPGKSALSSATGGKVTYKTRKEAIAAAMEHLS